MAFDKVGPASFEVLDYKTGGFWRNGTGRACSTEAVGFSTLCTALQQWSCCGSGSRTNVGRRAWYNFPSRKGRRERMRINAPGQKAIASGAGGPSRSNSGGHVRARFLRGRLQILRLQRCMRPVSRGTGRAETGRCQAAGIREAYRACLTAPQRADTTGGRGIPGFACCRS